VTEDKVITCKHCGGKLVYRDDKLEKDEYLILEEDLKEREKIEEEKKSGDWSDVSHSGIDSAAADIILTTSYLVAGREIESEIEILTAECVFGMNIFKVPDRGSVNPTALAGLGLRRRQCRLSVWNRTNAAATRFGIASITSCG